MNAQNPRLPDVLVQENRKPQGKTTKAPRVNLEDEVGQGGSEV